jgi:hypothetical protein
MVDLNLLVASLIATLGAFGLGAIDGIYFHLQRFRLFAHTESRLEHILHTGRALLVAPALILLYLIEPAGPLLYSALAIVIADQALMVLDLLVERRSRARWGGIPHAEYMVHVAANALHAVGLALAFASRPASSWSLTASYQSSRLPAVLQWVTVGLVAGAAVAGIQHLLLLRSSLRAVPAAQPEPRQPAPKGT